MDLLLPLSPPFLPLLAECQQESNFKLAFQAAEGVGIPSLLVSDYATLHNTHLGVL